MVQLSRIQSLARSFNSRVIRGRTSQISLSRPVL
uniref:Tif1 n=1 Tax=Arundo donax TaxID=35708 RepID=A0A0A9ERL4_ARUDO